MKVAEVALRSGLAIGGLDNGFRRNCTERPVEVVNRFNEIFSELGDGKVAGVGDVALGTLLEVAEIGDGAEVFVLISRPTYISIAILISVSINRGLHTLKSADSFFLSSSCFFSASTCALLSSL